MSETENESKLNKNDKMVIQAIQDSSAGLTLVEIADKIGLPEKKVFRVLRKLFQKELIDCDKNRRYTVSKK